MATPTEVEQDFNSLTHSERARIVRNWLNHLRDIGEQTKSYDIMQCATLAIMDIDDLDRAVNR